MQARRQGGEAAAGSSGLTARDDSYLLGPREGREGKKWRGAFPAELGRLLRVND